ncbi:hypothetical protein EM868_14145 [Cupriavidus gilardii]|uniref:hypothetical protein n=1 Tax=Cupriavidus gilardii TaxID=82541 RepID=UPI001EE58EF1|nr:hypothetical protein [Cupriavidus gilardii]MCG5260035.1 hypothetical protein [Cupriavidus gilardii]MDF9430932.1 hypothetical protein [Cupriavidus gilardii]
MNPIPPPQHGYAAGNASLFATTPAPNVDAMSEQPAVGTHNAPPHCTEVRALATRLDQAIANAGSDDPNAFVIVRLADLRQMDNWRITIHGETLRSYFDLGSIDDVEQRYPVTLDEARWLRRAVAALNDSGCRSASRGAPWRRMV